MAIFKVSKVRISNYEPEVSIILDYDELERIFIALDEQVAIDAEVSMVSVNNMSLMAKLSLLDNE